MSKISIVLAILMIAIALCLSGCGDQSDTAEPSQSSSQQSPSQGQENAPTGEGSAESGDQSGAGTDQRAADGDSQTDDNPSSSQQDDDSGADNRTDPKDPVQSTEPEMVIPTTSDADSSQERDNAEVNIDDL